MEPRFVIQSSRDASGFSVGRMVGQDRCFLLSCTTNLQLFLTFCVWKNRVKELRKGARDVNFAERSYSYPIEVLILAVFLAVLAEISRGNSPGA
jgi:hypothetical protein